MNSNSVVVITGAARGIGLELFKQCLSRGARVVAGVRSPDKATELKQVGLAHPGRAWIFPLDVTSDESATAFAALIRKAGLDRVDILINNAGIYIDGEATLETLETSTLMQTLDTNVAGPVRVTRALLSALRSAPQARIATLSSLMGSIADNSGGGSYAYRMSKSAVNMFVKTLSIEERDMIALALHPGWVKTEMGGSRAPLAPDKSAEGLITVIETTTPGDSGKFFNHAGRELPW
jgi:NAD(P)-dependent dehydrogenase (short-subunit alcohol dehydrogenase family)